MLERRGSPGSSSWVFLLSWAIGIDMLRRLAAKTHMATTAVARRASSSSVVPVTNRGRVAALALLGDGGRNIGEVLTDPVEWAVLP